MVDSDGLNAKNSITGPSEMHPPELALEKIDKNKMLKEKSKESTLT